MITTNMSCWSRPRWLFALVLNIIIFALSTNAAIVPFKNCLDPSIVDSTSPRQLQFVPLFVDVKFSTDSAHTLIVTVFGNVTGQAYTGDYPPSSDTAFWSKPPEGYTIANVTADITTIFNDVKFLNYNPYRAPPAPFCDFTGQHACPLAPLFGVNASDPALLHSFYFSHQFEKSFSFGTLVSNTQVQSGNRGSAFLACVEVNVTPDLGKPISASLRWVPFVILLLVGVATLLAAKYGPSSSPHFFYWTSYYGRDEGLLRLVTPGFADCLQYIQFIVLTGSLSLAYPGYYQPVISKAAWSTLSFNQSFVSKGDGTQSLIDGVYTTNATYGLGNFSNLVGMTDQKDLWATMIIWLTVITFGSILIFQTGFFLGKVIKKAKNKQSEDLRRLNLPFSAGLFTRVIFNFFLLPLISFSLFQLVIAAHSLIVTVVFAIIILIIVIGAATWIMYFICHTQPRTVLFDHLPFLLAFGPLYNTFADAAAPFSAVPILLNIMRGIAIGAVQASGIAQVVILAICEIVSILTIIAFKPYQRTTSMNSFQIFFSLMRLVAVLLSVAFVSTLQVSEGVKGWVGYAILLIHAIVLAFGFFINAIGTLIGVIAQMAGVRNKNGGIMRVFGARQLNNRDHNVTRESLAATLSDEKAGDLYKRDIKSSQSPRLTSLSSLSGSGALLMDHRNNYEEENSGRSAVSPGLSTPGAATPLSFMAPVAQPEHVRRRSQGSLTSPAPFYRPPRQRRLTIDALNDPIVTSNTEEIQSPRDIEAQGDQNRASVLEPAFGTLADLESDKTKQSEYYASRESDFLYGVRGPPLSANPSTRKRVTGPADPLSPVENASSWFRSLFRRRSKEKGKGFEVVRSLPVTMMPVAIEDQEASWPLPQPNRGTESPTPKRSMERTMTPDMAYALKRRHQPNRSLDNGYIPSPAIRSATDLRASLVMEKSEEPSRPLTAPRDQQPSQLRTRNGAPFLRPLSLGPNSLLIHDDESIYSREPGTAGTPGPHEFHSRNNSNNINNHSNFHYRNSRVSSMGHLSSIGRLSNLLDDGVSEIDRTSTISSEGYPESLVNGATTEGQVGLDGRWTPRPQMNLNDISTGQVRQHVAGDSIHSVTQSPAYFGSQAELIEAWEAQRRSQSMGRES